MKNIGRTQKRLLPYEFIVMFGQVGGLPRTKEGRTLVMVSVRDTKVISIWVWALSISITCAYQQDAFGGESSHFRTLVTEYSFREVKPAEQACDIIDGQLLDHIHWFERTRDSGWSPPEIYPPVFLDSVRGASTWWYLLTTGLSPRRNMSYLQQSAHCQALWIGPAYGPEYCLTTLRGRFLGWGRLGGSPASYGDAFDESGRGAIIGDTVFVAGSYLDDPANSEAIARFNSAIHTIGLSQEPLVSDRVLDLYLEAALGPAVIFVLNSPDELDRYYLFFHSAGQQSDSVLDQRTWDRLLSPGVRDGTFLRWLPVPENQPRPNLPLPSVVLEHFDWVRFARQTTAAYGEHRLATRTIYVDRSHMLYELEFVLAEQENDIEMINMRRVVDFRTHFYRYLISK